MNSSTSNRTFLNDLIILNFINKSGNDQIYFDQKRIKYISYLRFKSSLSKKLETDLQWKMDLILLYQLACPRFNITIFSPSELFPTYLMSVTNHARMSVLEHNKKIPGNVNKITVAAFFASDVFCDVRQS